MSDGFDSGGDFKTEWTKYGDIKVSFWCANDVHPWDLAMSIEYQCLQKYPDFALTSMYRYIRGDISDWFMIFKKGQFNGR